MEPKTYTEFKMNENIAGLFPKDAKVTVVFKENHGPYGDKCIFHNINQLGAYDWCVGTSGFMITGCANGMCFDLEDIESVTVEPDTEFFILSEWSEVIK